MGDDDERDRTLWCGNLDDRVTEEILYDLFLQAGPLQKVKRPIDQDSKRKKAFAFITFQHAVSVPYTVELLNGICLFDRNLKLQYRPGSIHETAGMAQNTPSMQNQMMNMAMLQRSFSAPGREFNGSGSPTQDQGRNSFQRSAHDSHQEKDRRRSGRSRDRDYRDPSPRSDHGYHDHSPHSDREYRDRSPHHDRDDRSRGGNRDRSRDRDRHRSSGPSQRDWQSGAAPSLLGHRQSHSKDYDLQPQQRSRRSHGETDDRNAELMSRLGNFYPNQNILPTQQSPLIFPWQLQGFRGNFHH